MRNKKISKSKKVSFYINFLCKNSEKPIDIINEAQKLWVYAATCSGGYYQNSKGKIAKLEIIDMGLLGLND